MKYYKAVIKLNYTVTSIEFMERNPSVNRDSLQCVLSQTISSNLWLEYKFNKQFIPASRELKLIRILNFYDFTIIMLGKEIGEFNTDV